MTSVSSETIWSSMIATRQLSITYYTLSTCLTDFLHQYIEISSSTANNISSSLFHKLDQKLFASSISSANQATLLDEYSNILLNILKQNSLHNNIIQNVRRLFRLDSILKELFTNELNEHCQCQECDCTISNNITDVIHEVCEIRASLLTESTQQACSCFRCGDQNQYKIVTFKKLSPCLALTVNRLNVNATDQLTDAHGVSYELSYIIEFDSSSRSIINVYLKQNVEFIKVDGQDRSSRTTTLNSQGKFLTLWLSRSTVKSTSQTSEFLTTTPHILQPSTTASQTSEILTTTPHTLQPSTITSQISDSLITVPLTSEPLVTTAQTMDLSTAITENHSYLSPPQSSSSSQILTNNDNPLPNELSNATSFDDILIPSDVVAENTSTHDSTPINIDDDDDSFWNSLTEQSTQAVSEKMSTTSHDQVGDLYLTLLHSTSKNTPTKSRVEHDRAVSTLATDVLWPLILDQSSRRGEKRSSSSTTTTVRSISSNSSTKTSSSRNNHSLKSSSSINTSRRTHPYAKA